MDDIEMSVNLPLDSDGFMRRECPNCERQFKWHDGPANEEAEDQPPVDAYFCPLCATPAGLDQWWTQEQLDYMEGMLAPAVQEALGSMFDKAIRGSRNNFIQIERKAGPTRDNPLPLTEPDDMSIVVSPCHPYEPVKIPDDEAGPVHCLICGAKFAL